MFRKSIAIAVMLIATISFASSALAAWPERPVRFVLGSQAGSSIDMMGRIIAQKLSDRFGQPFVVNNVSGGGLGGFPMTMKNAKGDGYTIGLGADSFFSYNSLDSNAKFTIDDFEYLCTIFVGDLSYVTTPDKPWKDVREAFEWSKQTGNTINYMFQTSMDRAITELYARQMGAKLNMIPSTGPSAILTSLMGGHADIGYSGGLHYEQARAGKIKTLSLFLEEPSKNYPDVALVKDLFDPYYPSALNYRIIVAPKGFPQEAKDKLVAALEEIITSEEFREVVEDKLHFIVDYKDSDALTLMIHDQYEAHRRIIEEVSKK